MSGLPKFDPKAWCEKCGWSIQPAPPSEPKFGPKGGDGVPVTMPAGPPPPPSPPTVQYCNGLECPWAEDEDPTTEPATGEHMHQWCDTCGYEWLSEPLNAPRPDLEAEEQKMIEEHRKAQEEQRKALEKAPPAPAAPAGAPAAKKPAVPAKPAAKPAPKG